MASSISSPHQSGAGVGGRLLGPLKEPVTRAQLEQLARHMSSGVQVRDRRHRFKLYPQCFIGGEAVNWLVFQQVARDRPDAVRLGRLLVKNGFITQVIGEHDFEDKFLFFRFDLPAKNAPAKAMAVLAAQAAAAAAANSGEPLSASASLRNNNTNNNSTNSAPATPTSNTVASLVSRPGSNSNMNSNNSNNAIKDKDISNSKNKDKDDTNASITKKAANESLSASAMIMTMMAPKIQRSIVIPAGNTTPPSSNSSTPTNATAAASSSAASTPTGKGEHPHHHSEKSRSFFHRFSLIPPKDAQKKQLIPPKNVQKATAEREGMEITELATLMSRGVSVRDRTYRLKVDEHDTTRIHLIQSCKLICDFGVLLGISTMLCRYRSSRLVSSTWFSSRSCACGIIRSSIIKRRILTPLFTQAWF
jgi:hypothetical protein